MTREAIVIGGGVAGPATALALQKAGIEATVYEARPEQTDGSTGAFLTLASNGIAALRVLGADEAALATGIPTPAMTLRSASGKRLGRVDTGGTLEDGTASHTLWRGDLHAALRDVAIDRDIPFEHGKRLIAAETGDAEACAIFEDGTEARADVLIGCDGIHSTVRSQIDPCAPAPRYGGLLNTGGLTRGLALPTAIGEYEMIFGRRAFFGYVPAGGDETWWFANVPLAEEPTRHDLDTRLSAVAGHARLRELFEHDASPASALIEHAAWVMPPSPIHSIPHLPRWHRGRLLVLGDAAHAPTPSSGQGASLAIEDALVAAQCLRDEPTPAAAFAAFEAQRRRRVEKIIKWAERMNSSKAAGPVTRVLRHVALPPILRLTAGSKAQRQVWEHRVAWTGGQPITSREGAA